MANVGEAQITRLTRERLAEIKKFLPVRDSFRDNLQTRQQQRAEFTADTEQLLKPVTTATETVITATLKVGTETAKIGTVVAKVGTETEKRAKTTRKIKERYKTLPDDIVAAQPVPVDVSPEPVNEQTQGRRVYRPGDVLTTTTLDEIFF